jgi:hypothetical protein
MLLAAQEPLTSFDEAAAALARVTDLSLPTVFLAAHLLGLAALAAAALAFGHSLFGSRWTTAALVLALSLRHRIPRTGANTLEGSLHPRMLAFAIGVAAVATFLRGRSQIALALAAAAAVLHPTTSLWFVILLVAAVIAADNRMRRPGIALAAIAGVAAAWALTLGPLRDRLTRMDEAWVLAFASKDYVFPTDWPLDTWAVNGAYVLVILAIFQWRRSLGMVAPREPGLVAGCLVLAAIFLLSLPFVAMRVALAVQLQTSRVFWLLDLFAISYLVWQVVEAPWRRVYAIAPRRRQQIAVAALAIAALSRGLYVLLVEHPGRPLVERNLHADSWTDAMNWIRTTPMGTHVIADPGHAWRFGTSVRVSGERDVYLEEVKDAAVALYSRDVAVRVVERTAAIGDFSALTSAGVQDLARRYELDLFVSERSFDLPVAYENERFTVYRLQPAARKE